MLKQTHCNILRALALVFTLPLLVTAADVFIDETTEVFDSGPGDMLDIEVGRGNVEIYSHPGDQVSVHVVLSVKAKNQETADKAFNSVETILEQSDGVITLKLKQKRDGSFFNFKKPSRVKTNILIQCPEIYNLNVDTGSGNISVSRINGELSFDTGSGNISGNQLSGEIDSDTGSGNVVLVDVEGNVSGDTGSGNITVKNLSGAIYGDTGSGNIRVFGSIAKFNADTGSGNVNIKSDSAITENSKADTGSGNISISLPANSSFLLRAETNSGRVSNDFPVTNLISSGKKHIQAQINEGGPKIIADAGSGDVSFKSLKQNL